MKSAETETSDRMHAFLLRAWQEEDQDASWRFRFRIIQTGEVFGFNDLESLQLFLQELFNQDPREENIER